MISGLILAPNATSPASAIDVSSGIAGDFEVPAGLTLNTTANLDVGTISANAGYHVHLIRRDSDGSVTGLISASASFPVMPDGYTARRRIGSFITGASGGILPFTQHAGWVQLNNAKPFLTGAPNTVATLRNVPVPLGVKFQVRLAATALRSGAGYLIVRDPATGVPSVTPSEGDWYASGGMGVMVECWTNASGQIYTADTAPGATLNMYLRGWFDHRDDGL